MVSVKLRSCYYVKADIVEINGGFRFISKVDILGFVY